VLRKLEHPFYSQCSETQPARPGHLVVATNNPGDLLLGVVYIRRQVIAAANNLMELLPWDCFSHHTVVSFLILKYSRMLILKLLMSRARVYLHVYHERSK
jgi:hypothetical protein